MIFAVYVCTIWFCATEPFWVYERIEPCKALSTELTSRLPPSGEYFAVCKGGLRKFTL
jgi:hypothetical protein